MAVRYGCLPSQVLSEHWSIIDYAIQGISADNQERLKLYEIESLERWQVAAFIGWQQGAAGKKKFNEYLKALNLAGAGKKHKQKTPEEIQKQIAEGTERLRQLGLLNDGTV